MKRWNSGTSKILAPPFCPVRNIGRWPAFTHMDHISRRQHERPASPTAPFEVGLRETFKADCFAIPENMEELLRRLAQRERTERKPPHP
jgi:hypothetical protein